MKDRLADLAEVRVRTRGRSGAMGREGRLQRKGNGWAAVRRGAGGDRAGARAVRALVAA